jgi:Tol biopolymer transport system component
MHSDDRWPELASFVDALLDTPVDARDALIESLSGGNTQRRAELQALRAECEQEPRLLSAPAAERFAALLEEDERFPDGLRERYRPTGVLGRGGMATVFLARDVRHARDVAVKVMHPFVAAALGVERFLGEIEMVAQMHHPHIVPLYDSGDADGALYYVMPYEPGLSLRQRLARDGPLDAAESVVMLRDVCDALAYAHARGIVHSDIKPDNVLVSGRHALLTDFGIARTATAARDGAGVGVVALGTPAYMAPEQISGGTVDHRTDIYALGVLGYELLAGRTPFTAETREATLQAHLNETPPPLVGRTPEIPPRLATVMRRCLEKRPEDRWQSAEELMRQLEGIGTAEGALHVPRSRWRGVALLAAGVVGIAAAVFAIRRASAPNEWRERWAKMHIERVTDFPGSEVDATISADGTLVAFLADRDGAFDAFVSEVGSGRFLNLTKGRLRQLFNEDVRNVGFTPDGAQLWVRVADLTSPASVSMISRMGGPLRPFLPTAVMAAWSPDGAKLAYHETTPGDPIFVGDAKGQNVRRIYIAPAGVHSHDLSWSPDGRYLYFSHGLPPNEMDIWRIPATGGGIERVTTHNSRVGFPVLLDDRTLLYTATEVDGTGPWLYLMDLRERTPVRLSSGVENVISVAAAADQLGKPRRLVVTVSNPNVELWSVPIGDTIAGESEATPMALPTARSRAPRYAPDSSLLYLASRGGADALWRLSTQGAAELWRPSEGTLAGAAGVSPNGKIVCGAVRLGARATLQCRELAGTREWTLARSLDVRGAPSWSPDGAWVAMAARDGDATHVFKIPVAGGNPRRLVDSVSFDPVWSPDGSVILYSGTPRGRSVPVKGVRPDGTPYPLPFGNLIVDRLADSYRFLPSGHGVVVKLGGFRHQDFWLFDTRTGARRQLTQLKPGESVSRFDVSRDGRRILFERAEENSDVALIEIPERGAGRGDAGPRRADSLRLSAVRGTAHQ